MIEVRVPATSANLGPGFDCLGFALNLYNKFKIEECDSGLEVIIRDKTSGKILEIPVAENLFVKAIEKLYKLTGKKLDNLKLIEEVEIPFARGLGSSATAVIAGLTAGNYLLGNPFTEKEIIDFAVEMEGHPDNVLPALKGGFIINVLSKDGLVFKKLKLAESFKFIIVIPDFELKTEEVRRVLPDKIGFKDAVFNLSRTALLVTCLQERDLSNLKVAMEDSLHQDYRAKLIPGFNQVIEAAYQEGAAGVALSGAGPAILAIANKNTDNIGKRMVTTFENIGISSRYLVKKIDNIGCKIIT